MINARFQEDFAYGACYETRLPFFTLISFFHLSLSISHTAGEFLAHITAGAVTLTPHQHHMILVSRGLTRTATARNARRSEVQRRFAASQTSLPSHRAATFTGIHRVKAIRRG